MKFIIYTLINVILLSSTVFTPSSVVASGGLPGSAKFGYGARIDINGLYLDKSITTAVSMGFDWIAIEFDWEKIWPEPSSPPNIAQLSDVINKAYKRGLSVLLTISNPAKWAINESGPDPQTTANLILSLVNLYANKVSAIELFPGVNTLHGWKATPDPNSYLGVLRRVQETLNYSGKNISVITTLTPVSFNPSPQDFNDLDFLDRLYLAGGKSDLTIVGIKFNKLGGVPYSNPESITLRHYEEIRNIMLKNEHEYGLIWITGFRCPNGEITQLESPYTSPSHISEQEQSNWLEEAFTLIKAQLYIGAAFFDQINPPQYEMDGQDKITLISPESNFHLATDQLRLHVGQQTSKSQIPITGTSDESQLNASFGTQNTYLTILLKKYTKEENFKHP